VSLKFLHGESRVTISGQEYSVISEWAVYVERHLCASDASDSWGAFR
jgi:hypothetical protein